MLWWRNIFCYDDATTYVMMAQHLVLWWRNISYYDGSTSYVMIELCTFCYDGATSYVMMAQPRLLWLRDTLCYDGTTLFVRMVQHILIWCCTIYCYDDDGAIYWRWLHHSKSSTFCMNYVFISGFDYSQYHASETVNTGKCHRSIELLDTWKEIHIKYFLCVNGSPFKKPLLLTYTYYFFCNFGWHISDED